MRVYLSLASLAGLVFGLMLAAVLWLIRPGPPMVQHAVKVMTPTVLSGTPVVMQYDIEVDRPCPAQIYGWLVRMPDGKAQVRYVVETGGYGVPGRRWVTVERPVPQETPTGAYCYRHIRTDICGDHTYTAQGLDACFQVQRTEPRG